MRPEDFNGNASSEAKRLFHKIGRLCNGLGIDVISDALANHLAAVIVQTCDSEADALEGVDAIAKDLREIVLTNMRGGASN